jgi:hypothetical protein
LEDVIVSTLNTRVSSSLRVEIEEARTTLATGQANLTELADAVQAAIDESEKAPARELLTPQVWEGGGLRVVWHARARRPGEEDEPVAVVAT